jgi:hypothetical protein
VVTRKAAAFFATFGDFSDVLAIVLTPMLRRGARRDLVAYGSTCIYRPVNSKSAGSATGTSDRKGASAVVSSRAGQRRSFSAGHNDRTDSRRGASGRGSQIPDPRNVPAEEWNPSGLVRLALEFGCQLINNRRSPLGCD